MTTATIMQIERIDLELPTKAQLKTLPLRAMVALAARCVRRVQSLYRSEHPRCAQVIEDTLNAAENFARGQTAEFSLNEIKFAAKFGRTTEARQIAAATSYLAYAVLSAQTSPGSDDAHQVAYRTWMSMQCSYHADPDVSFIYTAMDDFGYLSVMCEGRFPEMGEPIDPSADGPLGSLWCMAE